MAGGILLQEDGSVHDQEKKTAAASDTASALEKQPVPTAIELVDATRIQIRYTSETKPEGFNRADYWGSGGWGNNRGFDHSAHWGSGAWARKR